jgi:hypothetical protein
MNIGFSTGSLSKGDYKYAIELLLQSTANVVELSALRENELEPLINSLDELPLNRFNYVSFHAPSKLQLYSEDELINKLLPVKERGLNIILHPDIIQDIYKWQTFGSFLCIENMDKRKPIGRTVVDLEDIFYYLQEATFCLDLAHVRQIDSTMTEAAMMIKRFGNRLVQIHLSDINSRSIHERLNLESIVSYSKIAPLLNPEIPIVLESPIPSSDVELEMKIASFIFDRRLINEYLHGTLSPIFKFFH